MANRADVVVKNVFTGKNVDLAREVMGTVDLTSIVTENDQDQNCRPVRPRQPGLDLTGALRAQFAIAAG